MDPTKDKKNLPPFPLPGVPPVPSIVSREREVLQPTEVSPVEKDPEVTKVVQVNDDFEDQSRPIMPPPSVSVQIQEPKSVASNLDERGLRSEAKGSPSEPKTWKAVITLFERIKQPLMGGVKELSNS